MDAPEPRVLHPSRLLVSRRVPDRSVCMRVLLCCALVLSGCLQEVPHRLASPSGAFIATAEVAGKEAGSRQNCVRLKVTDSKTKQVITYQTDASDVQKWALAWSPSGSLVLYSSDVGTSAYDITTGQIVERDPTSDEKEVARQAYEKKYGTRPRA